MILDASVATKWFLKEEDSLMADNLLEQGLSFIAPSLIQIEVSSAIAKAVRFSPLSSSAAQSLNTVWHQRLAKGLIKLDDDIAIEQDGFSIATQQRHSLQDCLYVSLALSQNLPLLSADVKQSAIAKEQGVEVLTLAEVVC